MYFYPKQNTNHSPQTTVSKQVPLFFTTPTHTDVAARLPQTFAPPVLLQATAAVLPDVTCLVRTSGALYSQIPGFKPRRLLSSYVHGSPQSIHAITSTYATTASCQVFTNHYTFIVLLLDST